MKNAVKLLKTYHRPHSSLNKPLNRVTGFNFVLLTPDDVTDRLSRNVGKELPLFTT